MTAARRDEPKAPEPQSEPVPRWVRVRDRTSGHEYDVAGSAFDPDAHVRVNKSAQYPDLFGDGALSRPATYRTDLAGQPVPTQHQEP